MARRDPQALTEYQRGQRLKADDVNALIRLAKRAQSGGFGFVDSGIASFKHSHKGPSFFPIHNDSGEEMPSYGVGINYTANSWGNESGWGWRVRKPGQSAGASPHRPIVNCTGCVIPADSDGWGSFLYDTEGPVLYDMQDEDDPDATFGMAFPTQRWNIKDDSWAVVIDSEGPFVALRHFGRIEEHLIVMQQTFKDAGSFGMFSTVNYVESLEHCVWSTITVDPPRNNIVIGGDTNQTLVVEESGIFYFNLSARIDIDNDYYGNPVADETFISLGAYKIGDDHDLDAGTGLGIEDSTRFHRIKYKGWSGSNAETTTQEMLFVVQGLVRLKKNEGLAIRNLSSVKVYFNGGLCNITMFSVGAYDDVDEEE